MKKKVLSLMLVAAMTATLFAGCGNKDEGTTNNTPDTQTPAAEDSQAGGDTAEDPIANLIAATEGTVSLDLWCSETPEYQAVMAQIVDNFKAAYPEVDFDITIGAQSESEVKDRVLEDVTAAADVFVFADDQVTDLVRAGALQPVEATYTYNPAETNGAGSVDAASVDGKLYAYPLTASNGYFLFYDSTVFSEEDIQSWDGLLAKANEVGCQVGIEYTSGWYLYSFFQGAGCNLTLNDDGTNNCDWNNATGVAVAESLANMAKDPAFISIPDDAFASKLAEGDCKIKAYVDGTWRSGDIQAAYGDGYAAAKLPTFTVNGEQVQQSSYAGYKLVGVNAYSENIGWSMLLAEFISNEASQVAIFEATGEGPANTVAAASDAVMASPAIAALAAQSAYASPQRVGDKYWDPSATLGKNLAEGTVTDFQAALDEAVAGITAPVE